MAYQTCNVLVDNLDLPEEVHRELDEYAQNLSGGYMWHICGEEDDNYWLSETNKYLTSLGVPRLTKVLIVFADYLLLQSNY